jgi:hypothetical protein
MGPDQLDADPDLVPQNLILRCRAHRVLLGRRGALEADLGLERADAAGEGRGCGAGIGLVHVGLGVCEVTGRAGGLQWVAILELVVVVVGVVVARVVVVMLML